jgi:pimeloyl-ACP methyl ester carboxylesterase
MTTDQLAKVANAPRAAASDASCGYASVNGLELYYEVHGDGPPLVLLHGAMGTIDSCFARLLPALGAQHRLIAVELQGHGHTADVDRPLSYRDMADDVAALLRSLATGPIDAVGYSMGGSVGLELAMRHPDLVKRVVYAGGATYRRDGLHPEMLQDMSDAAEALEGSLWHQAYLRVAPRPDDWPRLVNKVMELDRFEGWTAEQIQAITQPVLVIVGDSDIVRPEHAVELFRLLGGGVVGDIVDLPASRLAMLPGTSHVGMLERFDWLHSMITDFLDPPRRSDTGASGA